MYRELDENNKSSLRERIDMSMRSPTNNWISDGSSSVVGLSKAMNPSKKSVSSERKNPTSNNSLQVSNLPV
jgi:hypothetical protein